MYENQNLNELRTHMKTSIAMEPSSGVEICMKYPNIVFTYSKCVKSLKGMFYRKMIWFLTPYRYITNYKRVCSTQHHQPLDRLL